MIAIHDERHPLSKSHATGFKTLLHHAQYIAKIQQQFFSLLPEELQPYVQVANAENQTLILQVDNTSWGTLLRYEIPALLETCEDTPALQHIQVIEFFIKSSEDEVVQEKKRALKPISKDNAKGLQAVAKYVTNPLLKKSLERLSEVKAMDVT